MAPLGLIASAVIAALVLGGCSTATNLLEGRKIDYKSAGQLPPLEIPPDLTAPSRENRYIVPEGPKGSTTYSTYDANRAGQPRPGAVSLLPTVDKMRIERSGSQRWLVVAEPPEKLWQVVKEFWQEAGFLVTLELPDTGVMETDWAENRAKIPQDFIRQSLGKLLDQVYSTSERDKFRTRLERGSADGTTEIYISHRGMIEVYTSGEMTVSASRATAWQPRPADQELEAEFLGRLMVRLGAKEERAKELLATAPQGLRATLVKQSDGSDLLQVSEPFDRAWRRVGLALDRVGFTVEDRDRQKGLYFVRYADPDADMPKEKPGLLSRLAFWRSDDKGVKAERFQVQVRAAADNSQVLIIGKEGGADNSKTSLRILSLLHEQLK
ncbi:MAG: outer membrane protein assembly factor BamC [Betaproteobacteria bacterium]|nr:outer membrane protein assembly factor BamC [Betaproteobacteria bacterium]